MPKLVTDRFDGTKLSMVIGQIRRAELTLDSLMVAMQAAGISELEIAGAPELDRALKGIASFGEYGHAALREQVLASGMTTPGSTKVPPEARRNTPQDAQSEKRKRAVNNGK